jgi:flagellar hook-associated protein 2
MTGISTGIGLISGINTANLIDSLIALESRGKVKLQQRISVLQAQRTALLDINARLLNFRNASKAFHADKIFQSALAKSSKSDILTASATTAAQPGTFTFTVRQLAAHSQKLTRGFADTATPLGITGMSFEFGKGALSRDRMLSELNGGAGVAGGKIVVTDRSGAQATIDLTDATTLNEALDRINGSLDVAVTASVSGDRIVITDTSGGAGTLSVANAIGFTTATDLGIAGSAAPGSGVITGASISYLAAGTALSTLNDGNGVLVRNNVSDLRIVDRNGVAHDIDLGRLDVPIDAATLLADLNNGAGVAISSDHDNPDLLFVDRDGTEHQVNLTGVTTVGELISRVASETGGKITLSVTDGKRLTVTDHTGGEGTLKVLGAGLNGTKTASDLGILKEAGVDADSFAGTLIPNKIEQPAATTLGQVIARINEQTGGAVIASVGPDGVSIRITDTTGGGGALTIASTAANPQAARALGIETGEGGAGGGVVDGRRLIADLGSVLVGSINGGGGLGGADSLDITDRNGNSVTVTGLSAMHSLSQAIAAINEQAAAAGVAVTVGLNSPGNGLLVADTSGGSASNLIITGEAAEALGIQADIAATSVRGSNLQLQYVSPATRLGELNYGRGIGHGSFRITDGFGRSATININANQTTVQDVIQVINAQAGGSTGLAIRARINDTGDGIIIEEDLTDADGAAPFVAMKVESISGTTAKDLNILGTAATIEGAFIDGSYERTLSFNAGDTLAQIVAAINAAGLPVSASILNTGSASGATPYRINFTSAVGGAMGEMLIDAGDFDLGLTTLQKGQDAKVYFGSPDSPGGGFLLTSQTNTVKDALAGVTLNLHAASSDQVTITVSRDTETILKAVNQFVTTFNDAMMRINGYDHFDVDTQQKGVLLGNSTTARLRDVLHRTVRQQAQGVSGQFQFLREVGIRVGAKGELTFDESKFLAAYENDPAAVEKLFAAYETVAAQPQEIAPGVTIPPASSQVPTVRGMGPIFNDLLAALTDGIDGTVTRAEKNFQSMIDLAKQRVGAMDQRLEARRKQLQRQFAAMESSLAQLQGQGGALGSLNNNLLLMSASILR